MLIAPPGCDYYDHHRDITHNEYETRIRHGSERFRTEQRDPGFSVDSFAVDTIYLYRGLAIASPTPFSLLQFSLLVLCCLRSRFTLLRNGRNRYETGTKPTMLQYTKPSCSVRNTRFPCCVYSSTLISEPVNGLCTGLV